MDCVVRILIIGVGSIGRRHCNNLINFFESEVQVAALRSGRKEKICETEFYTFEEAEEKFRPDAVIVSTPTHVHYESIVKSLDHFKNLKGIFIEKPVVHSTKLCGELMKLTSGVITHIACPLRFHPVLKSLKHLVKNEVIKPLAVRVISSSYLPEWRKGVDYSKHYSAIREKGGGVVYELIHELDYIRWIFGDIKSAAFLSDKLSSLDIEAEDIGVGIFKTTKGTIVEYHVDFFGRKPVRKVEVFSDTVYGVFDILESEERIFYPDHEETTRWGFQRNDMHVEELKYFVELILNDKKSFNDVKFACKTLRIAEYIRESFKKIGSESL